MTTAHSDEGWQAAVRRGLRLGRLLPLGGAEDGAWVAEQAAVGVLRRSAAEAMAGTVVLGRVRVVQRDDTDEGTDAEGWTAPGAGAPPLRVPPVPPSALPPGPLAIEAEFEAGRDEPLPVAAERLRDAMFASAREALGLRVTAVDLRVTGLWEGDGQPPAREQAAKKPEPVAPDGVRGVTDVPGVAGLTRMLGSGPAESSDGGLRVELATSAGYRPLDVARAVRVALARERPDVPSVAVVVTQVEVRAPAVPA